VTEETWEQSVREAESEEQKNSWPSCVGRGGKEKGRWSKKVLTETRKLPLQQFDANR
jgi:hypothetical protein